MCAGSVARAQILCSANHRPGEEAAMLAEKFFLVLETLKSRASDGSVRVVSTTPRVPIRLPTKTTDKQVASR
ncbi:hypothetical protein CWO90_45465 [Bradyrhizobium sp. Leo121]|nr:hypothetical protein CWO90_45465 [Bradyrhizobium sp. Leo121]